jgi:hypothetical protein
MTRKINSSFTQTRETIMFFLPTYLTEDQSSEPATGVPISYGEDGTFGKEAKVMYLNPQDFNISEKKIVSSQLTKGGYMVQYWGEELPSVSASGTTGSAGIEGINVLRDIYRHEQIHFRKVLKHRAREAASKKAANDALTNAIESQSRDGFGGFMTNAADLATGGAYSRTVDGFNNAIDIIGNAFSGGGGGGAADLKTSSFLTAPTLASFATQVDMYYQGEMFRGFFLNFNVKESAASPGLFSYDFIFSVTRRTGVRENFMPWHRKALGPDGKTRTATEPNVSGDEFDYVGSNKSIEISELSFESNLSRGILSKTLAPQVGDRPDFGRNSFNNNSEDE